MPTFNTSSDITIVPRNGGYRLETQLLVPAPLEQVFPFFADAGNLELLTPEFLHFQILTPRPLEMAKGLTIDYRIRLRGIPISWRTEISEYDPPRGFVDRQVRGPYRYWIHEHRFEAIGDQTLVVDRVDYGVTLGWAVHPILVGPDLRKIFQFRREVMVRQFSGAEPMLQASA